MIKTKIEKIIKSKIENSNIKIFTEDNKHFNTCVISDVFKDKTLIERQKIIYELMESHIIAEKIHAFSFKTYTKDEWITHNLDKNNTITQ
ncbi:MAG TPA: BolA/IbaG family iron-sulfur metabolism protein [Candidatus Azoamicus sp. OHIO1]